MFTLNLHDCYLGWSNVDSINGDHGFGHQVTFFSPTVCLVGEQDVGDIDLTFVHIELTMQYDYQALHHYIYLTSQQWEMAQNSWIVWEIKCANREYQVLCLIFRTSLRKGSLLHDLLANTTLVEVC